MIRNIFGILCLFALSFVLSACKDNPASDGDALSQSGKSSSGKGNAAQNMPGAISNATANNAANTVSFNWVKYNIALNEYIVFAVSIDGGPYQRAGQEFYTAAGGTNYSTTISTYYPSGVVLPIPDNAGTHTIRVKMGSYFSSNQSIVWYDNVIGTATYTITNPLSMGLDYSRSYLPGKTYASYTVTSSPSGGVGPYVYRWSVETPPNPGYPFYPSNFYAAVNNGNGQSSVILDVSLADTYIVTCTVTDANQASVSQTISIGDGL